MNDPESLDPAEAEKRHDHEACSEEYDSSADKENKSFSTLLLIVKTCAGILLLVALADLPYEYYTFLRWVVCSVAAISAVDSHGNDQYLWVWAFSFVAILFNPVLPVHLDRSTWILFDIAAGSLMLTSAAKTLKRSF